MQRPAFTNSQSDRRAEHNLAQAGPEATA